MIVKNPIDVVHPKEIRLFLKFKKIKAGIDKKYSINSEKIAQLLRQIEKKYPALLFGIRKSKDFFNCL